MTNINNKFYRTIIENYNLSSLGCLDFLDGMKGGVKDVWDNQELFLEKMYFLGGIAQIDIEEGLVIKPNGQKIKIGKFLAQNANNKNECERDLAQKLLRMWETRLSFSYQWKISTDPNEVLEMSTNKVWTSCMRPDGAYKFGPLDDYKMGTAIVLFYKPGADAPCGRTLLRPSVNMVGKPVIIHSGIIYGNGAFPNELYSSIAGISCYRSGVAETEEYGSVYCDYDRQGGINGKRERYKDSSNPERLEEYMVAFAAINKNWEKSPYSNPNKKTADKTADKTAAKAAKENRRLEAERAKEIRNLSLKATREKVKTHKNLSPSERDFLRLKDRPGRLCLLSKIGGFQLQGVFSPEKRELKTPIQVTVRRGRNLDW
jgi:hypothetical protein